MQTIEVTTPYAHSGKPVKSIEIGNIKFAAYATLATNAATNLPKDTPFGSAMRTARMIEQATLILEDGTRTKLDYVGAMAMPFPIAKQVIARLYDDDDNDEKAGAEIITKGDGISTPIHIKLGNPIAGTSSTPGEDKAISELEFLVKTYGDIEKAMGEPNALLQAVALLRYVARPVNGLLAMPSWAVDQVSLSDGNFIAEKIVPAFFD